MASFDDRQDFEDAERGFIATLDPLTITAADRRVVFDSTPFAYLDDEPSDTVNPSRWRQAQLCWKNGLYEVIEGIFQVRSFDIARYREHSGDRPVTGVIVTREYRNGTFGGLVPAPRWSRP